MRPHKKTAVVPHVEIPAQVRPLLQRVGALAEQQGMAAYAVGGCVRDWWFGITTTMDLDVTVEGDGVALAHAVAQTFQASLQVHQPFGTATLLVRRSTSTVRVDLATCRRETYAKPAAYPTVTRGTLEEDLVRRDFTINATALALSPPQFGTLIDPCEGAQDVDRKILRILHARSFLDDPSRMLRGIRFAQRFDLTWEPATLRAAIDAIAAGALGWLNAGRLRKELELMLREPNPLACLQQVYVLLVESQRVTSNR